MGLDIHGSRFDIFLKLEDGRTVEIEMQVSPKENIPRRLRYYGSIGDMVMLEKSIVYSKLADAYIIMICPFDYYEQGRHIYTFTNRCKEDTELELGDGCTKIVLNANGTKDDINDKLKSFLDYVAGDMKTLGDEYIKKLDDAVKKAKMNKEWRREFMLINMRDLEKREEGIEIGREEGRAEGRNQEQRNRIAEMLQKGKTPQAIADFCGYPMQLIKDVEKSLLVLN